MSQKRSSEDDDSSKPNKKWNFNLWGSGNSNAVTPPPTPTSTSKYDYNLWGKNTAKCENSKICDLKTGNCNGTIRFRVSLKTFRKDTKKGPVFNFNALDETSEIQITVFSNLIDKFFDLIVVNKTFELKNFVVKSESPIYPSGTGNKNCIHINGESIVNVIENFECREIPFNFSNIEEVECFEKNTKCDFVGILGRDFGSETTSTGKFKRDLSITDKSKKSIILTLWGDAFGDVDFTRHIPLIVRNGVVSEFMGKKVLMCSVNSMVWFCPDHEAANDMKDWFEEEFKNIEK